MTDTISIKQGTSLAMEIQWTSDDVGVDLTGYTVDSQVRKRTGELIADLTCTIDADQVTNPGVVMLEADTTEWPANLNLDCDVRFTSGGNLVYPTTTFVFHVVPRVTR